MNVSLILPKNSISALSIDDGYQAMVDWLEQTRFGKLGIEIGEVADSYCPGKYDLSIKGKKIAGIAQRRVKEGVAIMMYLSVNGDQNLRGKIVRSYYQSGLRDQFGVDYPSVNSVKKELLQVMPHHDQTDSLPNFYQLEEYQRRVQNMQQRNTLIQEVLNDL